ncbi:MAG TPA: GNAT family N-acetyltransferase, partial [Terriglobales bacterium]|nr:GNAT family N-acetyltransferase [Terriglobales bacterium]
MNTILETPRLLLREFIAADCDPLFSVIGDAETMAFYLRPFTRRETEQWIDRNQRRYRGEGHGLRAAVLKGSGEFIGDCGLASQDVDGERLIEIAYHIRRDHWNQGYATEGAQASMRYGFECINAPKLISLIRPENKAS